MDDEKAPPALFGHCVDTYKAMLAESYAVISRPEEPVTMEDGEYTSSVIVYEGFLTQLITGKLNLSVPYYTSVTKALVRMGCIRQLRRGGGTSPSQWEMIYEPTLEAFYRAEPPKQPKQTREDQTNAQIAALSARVAELEAWQEGVNEFLTQQFGAKEVQQ